MYKVLFSKEDSNFIVLQPEINKYLSWPLSSPQQTIELIDQKNIKTPVNSYMIFKMNCKTAILESQGFVKGFDKIEIAKTIASIWKNTDEDVRNEYHKLSRNVRKLQSIYFL